jgi:triacylglycerol lipase
MRRLISTLLTLLTATAVVTVGAGTANAEARTPVVFVHGYNSSGSTWNSAKAVFRSAGYTDAELFAFTYSYNQSNATSAANLATYVTQVRNQTGAAKVDIVNHSMGGLVSRWYVKQLGGTASVNHWASLAGANHGTTVAALCSAYPSCQQMTPGSSFLSTLNSGDETPGTVKYRTWYSSCDGVINPYTSTALTGATNTLTSCTSHGAFLTSSTILGQVVSFLGS